MRTSIQACGAATTTLAWPKPSGAQQLEPRLGVGDLLAHQILAGDAEMRRAGGELADDLGRGDIGDLDARQAGDRAAIVARAAPLHELEPGAGEERRGAFLQPPLRGDGEDERAFGAVPEGRRHQRSPPFASRSSEIAAPTAGMSSVAPRRRASPS